MGANEKVAATYHPRQTWACEFCTSEYSSRLAALDCEDQCRAEDADRKAGRMFRMHRED